MVYSVPVICMLKLKVVMVASIIGDTINVIVAWATSFGASILPWAFHDSVIPFCAFVGIQLDVRMLSVALIVPVFLT